MANYLTTDTALAAVADAIREKGGTSGELVFPDGFVSAIEDLPTGGGGITIVDTIDEHGGTVRQITATMVAGETDVMFYDYDGTVVAGYSASEFANLTEMPANPAHPGLTAQGWNWTLSDAKAYVANHGRIVIGQMYITNDGKTRLYIHIQEKRNVLPFYWIQGASEGISIDWGDGTTAETFSGTGNKNTTHTYANAGDYIITITSFNGTFVLGNGTNTTAVLGGTVSNTGKIYANTLRKVELGTGIGTLGSYGFFYCTSLESISIPQNITVISSYAFACCYSLKHITVPINVSTTKTYGTFENCRTIQTISNNAAMSIYGGYSQNNCFAMRRFNVKGADTGAAEYSFSCNYALEEIELSEDSTFIGNYAFYNCGKLQSIKVPNNVTSIGSNAFGNCYSMTSAELSTSLQTISSSAFNGCHSLSEITIPATVTSIAASAFANCYGMKEYHFLSTTPPTLADSTVFTNIQSDCVIYVPSASLNTYKTETNWATYASYIQGE